MKSPDVNISAEVEVREQEGRIGVFEDDLESLDRQERLSTNICENFGTQFTRRPSYASRFKNGTRSEVHDQSESAHRSTL
ncbi:hypothetical protein HDU67_006475 [Dinochytrium kinnereticum]|nr:hypothetical protein HDU67_006475 [Dinochytrium kinnereticum]